MRPLWRFCCARARTVRLCELPADDRRDLVFLPALARNRRPPPFRDLVGDFFSGGRLSARFETAVARLTAFRTGRPPAAAFPTTAPITPPTTAPAGPAMLPIAAPVTAPAVCFGIGGTWISSDDGALFFFSGFGWSGINGGFLNIFVRYKDTSDDKVDIAVTKLKCHATLIRNRQLTSGSRNTVSFGTNNEMLSVAIRISNDRSSLVAVVPKDQLSKTGRAI